MTSKTWWWNRNWRPAAKIVVGLFDVAVLAVAATLAVHVIWWLFDAGEYELRVGMPDFGRMASALVMLIAARAIVWAMLVRCCGYLGIGGLLVTFLLLVVVATGVPPPSGMMTARAHKMARVGHNIAQLIARNDLEADGPRIDPLTCTNSTEFIRRMMERASPEFKSSIGSRELWCVAVNVTDDAPDTFPLLFAANIDPTDIPLSWDGQSGAEEVIPFKMLPEAKDLCLVGRVTVVIMKCGAARVIRPRYARRRFVLGEKPYKLKPGTVFLTPAGRIVK